ncbi:MAG: circularly permuted type 2 ATP-grasp protein [Pseudomonadota bacterium]
MPAPAVLDGYAPIPGTFDELVEANGATRPHAQMVAALLANMSPDTFARCQALAELSLAQRGVTFSVYSDARGTEKVMPVCLVPRVIASGEWAQMEKGLIQRLTTLQLFLDDLYGDQSVLADRVIPTELLLGSKHYLPQLRGMKPPGGVRIHIAGIDLIRSPDGVLRVLEDNLRTPSGVSYVIENRLITKRVFPTAMDRIGVRRVDDYPVQLVETLRSVSPDDPDGSTIVVLTPGPFNSAYFEHSFLARSMGIELVEASDLFVHGDEVFVRTTQGPRRVHVIYRRTDDAYIDPEFFRPDSLLGVPGLMRAWAAGRVTLANAPGNGVADDKAIYPFVPDLIRYYLGEDPILQQVPTHVCARRDDCAYVLEHLPELVVKAVDEAGGYGMLMGPEASAAELDMFRERIRSDPRRYIAQGRVELSTSPTWIADSRRVEPRRIDLRPFILTGKQRSWVLPGGLTRVALRAGSYVVNSSQGGGSKDTWVQADAT